MFVISNIQHKKRKFIIRTENTSFKSHLSFHQPANNSYFKSQTFSTSYPNPLPSPHLPSKDQPHITPIVPKIRKFRFKLSFVREPPTSLLFKGKKPKEGITISQKSKTRKNNQVNIKFACGRWKEDEHKRFIEAIIKYGNNWKQVQKHVRTRSSTQARSHAQKFFVKIKKAKLLNIKFDSSKASIKLFHELIQGSKPEDYEKIISTLTSIAFERNVTKKRKKTEMHKHNNDISHMNEEMSFKDELKDKGKNDDEYKCNNMHIIEEDMNKGFNVNGGNDLNGSFFNCNVLNSRKTSVNNGNEFCIYNEEKIKNGDNGERKNNEKELKYIFNALVNHISNDELYEYEQYQALANNTMNENENYFLDPFVSERKYSRRKRSSFNSISGYFKSFKEEKDFKNI